MIQDMWPARDTSSAALAFWLRQLLAYPATHVINVVKGARDILHDCDRKFIAPSKHALKAMLRERVEDYHLLGPILPRFYKFIESEGDDGFKSLNQALSFPTRLYLEDTDYESVIRDYCSTEEELRQLSLPEEIASLAEIAVEFFGSFVYTRPQLNSGATLQVRRAGSKAEKFHCFQDTQRTKLVFGDDYALSDKGCRKQKDIVLKLTPVPKDVFKKRLICPEDTTLMYYQWGIFDGMDKIFQKHPELGVNLHSQEQNQRFAQHASATGLYCTLDLSEASDRVPWAVVKLLFKGTPLYRYLLACRSEYVEVAPGEIIRMKKFAPMGSRMCFPIECAYFAIICMYAKRITKSRRPFTVYGDDIVVPVDYVSEVIDLLTRLGSKVNQEKSFGPYSAYTESCGKEYYNGNDVTAVKVPRKYDPLVTGRHKASKIESVMSLSNELFLAGFFRAQKIVQDRIPGKYLAGIPRCYPWENSSNCLISWEATNFHLPWRKLMSSKRGLALQKAEVKGIRLESFTKRSRILKRVRCRLNRRLTNKELQFVQYEEDAEYQLTLLEYSMTDRKALMGPDDAIHVDAGLTVSNFVHRWLPLS